MSYEKKPLEVVKAEMDAAAIDAQNDLVDMVDMEALEQSHIMDWWKKHYKKAGHRRLGRILMVGI